MLPLHRKPGSSASRARKLYHFSSGKHFLQYGRRVLSDHLRGQAIFPADLRVKIHAGTPPASLGIRVKFPEAEALGPAALPFKVVH